MTINGKTLVHVTNQNDGTVAGLYMVKTEKIDLFEEKMIEFEDQNDFDEFIEDEEIGERIFAEDLILDLKF